jgi:hypothetical protein
MFLGFLKISKSIPEYKSGGLIAADRHMKWEIDTEEDSGGLP